MSKSSGLRLSGSLAALVGVAVAPACVFDEAGNLHRDGTVEVHLASGVPTCGEIGHSDASSMTFEEPVSATKRGDAGLAITVETDGKSFDFSASRAVGAVIARGGDGAKIFRYTPPVRGDAGLTAPPDPRRSDLPHELQGVQFCLVTSGCTRAARDWQARADRGSQRYDDTWELLPEAAQTPFFLTDQSYAQVLRETRAAGAYAVLARAYIAAELSQLAGAAGDAVAGDFAAATEILEAYTPEEIAALPPRSELRARLVDLAGRLEAYAGGRIGPGSCERR